MKRLYVETEINFDEWKYFQQDASIALHAVGYTCTVPVARPWLHTIHVSYICITALQGIVSMCEDIESTCCFCKQMQPSLEHIS